MTTLTFYREQAAREQSLADGATLVNVRERCQSAANAWTGLAERLVRTHALRDAQIARHQPEPNENPDRGSADRDQAAGHPAAYPGLKDLWSDAGTTGLSS